MAAALGWAANHHLSRSTGRGPCRRTTARMPMIRRSVILILPPLCPRPCSQLPPRRDDASPPLPASTCSERPLAVAKGSPALGLIACVEEVQCTVSHSPPHVGNRNTPCGVGSPRIFWTTCARGRAEAEESQRPRPREQRAPRLTGLLAASSFTWPSRPCASSWRASPQSDRSRTSRCASACSQSFWPTTTAATWP